ncbi:MAG: hypothetical protein JXA03_04835 [Bacteroidales bacterium]|nr:hypothetical protein [Bacteroidales bacterium]
MFLSLATLFQGCSYEWKLARQYVQSGPDVALLVLPVDYLIKSNLKTKEAGVKNGMPEYQKDSLLMANSLFLKDVSDSVFLETFVNSYFDEIESLGIRLFTADYADSFLFTPTPAYIVNMAQMELEEFYLEQEDSDEFGGYVYYKTMYLNAVSINTWYEISRLNAGHNTMDVLFHSFEISDYLYGYFTENLFSGKVNYKYHISEMTVEDIYNDCEWLGKLHASWTFDYLLNRYITENAPPGKKRRFFLHYNRKQNSFDPASDWFTVMDGNE